MHAALAAASPVDRLVATGSRRAAGETAADNPAAGPPPGDVTATVKMNRRLRTS